MSYSFWHSCTIGNMARSLIYGIPLCRQPYRRHCVGMSSDVGDRIRLVRASLTAAA